jgi:hypothetical protein
MKDQFSCVRIQSERAESYRPSNRRVVVRLTGARDEYEAAAYHGNMQPRRVRLITGTQRPEHKHTPGI